MLTNIEPREALTSLARFRSREYETKSVHPKLVDEAEADGWTVQKRNKRSVRLIRSKLPSKLLEDRVWTLLYRMGFALLSADGGAKLSVNSSEPSSPSSQVDAVAID